MKHTHTQLKKMNTERLHTLFTKVTGRSLFNPYEERQYMIVVILGSENTDVKVDVLVMFKKSEVVVEWLKEMKPVQNKTQKQLAISSTYLESFFVEGDLL